MKIPIRILHTLLASATLTSGLTGADLPERILLWPQGAPGSAGKTDAESVRITENGDRVIANVHQPSLTPYLPKETQATGVAVVIAPGGGHRELWSTHEGHNLARWLSERGVAAFVLYNRLARETNSTYTVDEHALPDTRRAIQYIRSHAAEFRIKADRIGVMGFSAGGELAALADMQPVSGDVRATDPVERAASKPNFQALIYPGSSGRFTASTNSSPVFIVCGYNDRPDISKGMAEVYLKYKEAGVPAELHIYARAGHGFGMRDSLKGAVGKWPDRFVEWLDDLGMLKRD